jgi:choline kinase
MRPVIIGAGRGRRLGHLTDESPKPLVPVMGRPMLEWILDALAEGGFARKDVVYICGYQADVIRARYPEFTYVENRDWENNNILASLMCARAELGGGFVSTYADIVYRGSVVRDLVASPHAMALGCDTDWRRRYRDRSQHPESDGEKLRGKGDRVVEISRTIAPAEAAGEFIGVTKFTAEGTRTLLDAYDRVTARFPDPTKPYREGRTFAKAYMIDLFQEMIEGGADFRHVDMNGGYMEIDTLEDHASAQKWWDESAP